MLDSKLNGVVALYILSKTTKRREVDNIVPSLHRFLSLNEYFADSCVYSDKK